MTLHPKPTLRVVFDTSFYLAAAYRQGFAYEYLSGRNGQFLSYTIYASEAILLELQAKLETKLLYDRADAVATVQALRKKISIVYPARKIEAARDPNDDMVLECAVEAAADVVVSFDKDLLDLKEFEGIKIIHPSDLKYLLPLG